MCKLPTRHGGKICYDGEEDDKDHDERFSRHPVIFIFHLYKDDIREEVGQVTMRKTATTRQVAATQQFWTRRATVAALRRLVLEDRSSSEAIVFSPVHKVANPGTEEDDREGAGEAVDRHQLHAPRLGKV